MGYWTASPPPKPSRGGGVSEQDHCPGAPCVLGGEAFAPTQAFKTAIKRVGLRASMTLNRIPYAHGGVGRSSFWDRPSRALPDRKGAHRGRAVAPSGNRLSMQALPAFGAGSSTHD